MQNPKDTGHDFVQPQTLILRLSSLGDVILSSTVLQVSGLKNPIDWVTSAQYASLFETHPRVRRVYGFDRKSGLRAWVRLCRVLWHAQYSDVLDLHGSLRTQLMRVLFWFWGVFSPPPSPIQWRSVSKPRLRLFGYFTLKKAWPKRLRPLPWVVRFAQTAGGSGSERPTFEHLLAKPSPRAQAFLKTVSTPFLVVMPSSLGPGKTWPVENYVEFFSQTSILPVVVGTASDLPSYELVRKLQEAKLPHRSGLGLWDLTDTAHVLAGSSGYLGSDTGLAHLAEALGVRAYVLFGPTVPDQGFGPWSAQSRAVGSKVSCRPCGQDGRYCFRITEKYACLKRLTPDDVRLIVQRDFFVGSPSSFESLDQTTSMNEGNDAEPRTH
ncbi:MAG: glycosyltransferase family 9 protein [Bdellovibrionia bacterium]